MNHETQPAASLAMAELSQLNGKSVLVKSATDPHNPPAGRRGTLKVERSTTEPGLGTQVTIHLSFPELFTKAAHERVIALNAAQLTQLLKSENNGAYELTLGEDLDVPV